MLKWLAEHVAAKVLATVCVLGSILIVIWFWMHPEQLQALWDTVRPALVWVAFVAILPWALFFVPPMVVKLESNAASAAMLVAYLLIDVLVALWLAGWSVGGTLAWVVLIVAFLAATVYNVLVSEFIAEQSENGP